MLLLVQVAINGSSSLNLLTIIGHVCLMYRMISVRLTMSMVNMLQTHSDTRKLPLVTKRYQTASAHDDGKCE